MPAFSKLLWPFYFTATPTESTHNTSSPHPHQLPDDADLAQDEHSGAYSMSAAPDSGQADMEVAFGFGGDDAKDVVGSVENDHGVQQESGTTKEVAGVVDGRDQETLASGTAPTGTSDKVGPRASRPASGVEDGRDDGQAHYQGPDKIADPTQSEHIIDNPPQVRSEGAIQEQTPDRSHPDGRDDSHPRIKGDLPENEQATDSNRTDDKLAHLTHMSNKPRASEQVDDPYPHEDILLSSPLPSYSCGPAEQKHGPAGHTEPPSEPSSDSVFMQQTNAYFDGKNRASGSHSVLPEDTPNNLLTGAMQDYQEFNKGKDSQNVQPDSTGSEIFPKGLREASHEKKLPKGIRNEPGMQQHSSRLENVRHEGVSYGPIDEALWNGKEGYNSLQQPRLMLRSSPHPPPSFPSSMSNPHNRQILTPRFVPDTPYDAYGSMNPLFTHGYQNTDAQHVSAQPFRKDHLHTQMSMKRKHQEESDEDEEEPEVEDNYSPSESGDDEDSNSDSDSDSDEDVPLMSRKKATEAFARRTRAISSQSEYQDEGSEDQDEDQGEESEDQDGEQRGERSSANKEANSPRKEEMELVQHMDVDTRSPTQDSIKDATEPSPSLTIKLALPSAPAAGLPAIQRSLPVLKPEIAPEAPPTEEISFKLPQYYVEVIPLKTKDDYPEIRVNLPGMIRESLYLTPDHAHQEIHLLKQLFMPGQQSLAEPDPTPMVALLNFHTIATMVLEAYTAYEVGDLEAKAPASSSSSKKKNNDNDTEALDATKDEIFFAVIDRWRVGLTEEALRPSYKLIRGVQEFCDIALDVIYYLAEHGFVEGPQMMRKERSDKGAKKSKDMVGGKKASAGGGSEEDDMSEESTPKKRGRPSKAQSESPAKAKGKKKGVNTLQARKKAKTTPTPKGGAKKQTKGKKVPGVSVTPRKK
ncbi:hypothetical protein P171DRAFT_481821 [Karstenula rhodostoma CBS 690.94]|uniref:Uncharacterized protein n=1 Tax=Karstenula rhodostoma CBS 690.94 TaxID=1392251 RepID=A0A9P4UFQ2_9PLEO|nr:hypothetical protein P171DRAFT_481821 [Karstenula rhodostoma CBS 690.94]